MVGIGAHGLSAGTAGIYRMSQGRPGEATTASSAAPAETAPPKPQVSEKYDPQTNALVSTERIDAAKGTSEFTLWDEEFGNGRIGRRPISSISTGENGTRVSTTYRRGTWKPESQDVALTDGHTARFTFEDGTSQMQQLSYAAPDGYTYTTTYKDGKPTQQNITHPTRSTEVLDFDADGKPLTVTAAAQNRSTLLGMIAPGRTNRLRYMDVMGDGSMAFVEFEPSSGAVTNRTRRIT